jgi:hypothetical protein
MPHTAGFLLYAASVFLTGYGIFRGIRARSRKLAPQERWAHYHHTPTFWVHVFGRRRVKRLTFETNDLDQVL